MRNIIGIGDNVCDKYLHQKQMYPGGQALNVAVYCKRAGHRAAYLGVFGDDPVALHVQKTLEELLVDTTRCRREKGENGYAVVDLVDGDRVFVTSNKGGVSRTNPIQLTDADLQYISGFELVHTSNNSYIDPQLPKLAAVPPLLSYDFSGSWADRERARAVCPFLDFAFLSCSELAETEIKELLRRLHGWGAGIVAATRGEKGAMLFDGAKYYTQTPKLVQPVDTLGAGDSFAAGFLMSYAGQWLNSRPAPGSAEMAEMIGDALESAAALSAETCMVHGAFGCGAPIA